MQCECRLVILNVIIISNTNPFRACVLASARVQFVYVVLVMTWTRDLLRDAAYSLYSSHQCDLILTRSTNSAHLFKRYYSQAYKAQAYKDC